MTTTVMFTDLVSSTELLAQLGGAADAVRRAHFVTLRRALAANKGEEVKSLGDGVMAVFGSTVDAVSCGVAMQQAMSRLNQRSPGIDLAMRVGMSVGECTQEGGDWFGTPVVEAARLCAAGQGGQILVAELVADLARPRSDQRFAPVGGLVLKGLPRPFPACEVEWTPTGAVPLPPPLQVRDHAYFVGRDGPRAQLEAAWTRTCAGSRQAVFIGGEPGIGKTTLIAETSVGIHAGGGTVLFGRCDEEIGIAYQPFVEALGRYVAECAIEQLIAHVESHGTELGRLVPELSQRLPDLPAPPVADAEADRLRLFDAVLGLLTLASKEAPVLFVVDDIQWAAKPTLLLLTHLLRGLGDDAVMLASTYRDTETANVAPIAQLLAELRRQTGIEYLTLAGLDQAGVDAFIEAAAGHSLDESGLALARFLRAETNGNPFFVSESLRHLAETGAVAKRDGIWQLDRALDQIGLPDGVRDVVNGRLSRLSPTANRALTVGSVIGPAFSIDVLQRVENGNGSNALLDGLDEALRARLILEPPGRPGEYSFTHALVRQTLYESLTGARRAQMHWRVGEALEARHGPGDGPHLSALAHHFVEATPIGPSSKAVDYALRAAQQALEQVAYEEATVVLERGLEALSREAGPNELRRADLLLALAQCRAQALDWAGMREASLRAAESARAAGSAEHLAQAAYWYNGRPIAGTHDEVGIKLCEEALVGLGDSHPALRAVVLASLAIHLAFAGKRAGVEDVSQEALALANATKDPVAMAMSQLARYYTLWGTPRAAEMLALAEDLLLSSVVTPSGFFASNDGHRMRGIARILLGDRQGFEADVDTIEHLANELRSRFFLAITAQWRCMLALLDGRFDEVETLAAGQIAHAADDGNFVNSFAAQMLHLYLEQGRGAQLKPLVIDSVERNPGIPGFRAALGVTLAELGELDQAREEFEALAPDAFAVIPRDVLWPTTMALLTEVCVGLGDCERAATLYELFLPYTGLLVITGGGSYAPGAVDRYLGMLTALQGRHTESDAFFQSALALEERLRSPTLLTRTRYWYARMLLDRGDAGDRERAGELLATALETAERLGMAGLVARVTSVIADSDSEP